MLSSAWKAVSLVVVLTVVSKFAGFLREAVIADVFGSTTNTDIFFLASLVPFTLISAVSISLSLSFVPALLQIPEDERSRFINSSINTVVIASFVLTVFLGVVTPILVHLKIIDMSDPSRFIALFEVMLPMVIIFSTTGIMIGTLNAHERFSITSLIGIPYNITTVGFVLWLGHRFSLMAAAIGTTVGVFLQVPLLYLGFRRIGYRYGLDLCWRDSRLRDFTRGIVPIVFSSSSLQICFFIDRLLAARLGPGQVSAVNFSSNMVTMPYGFFVVTILTVIYPKLVRSKTTTTLEGAEQLVTDGVSLLTVTVVPLILLLTHYSSIIVDVLLHRGAFTLAAANMTANDFAWFSVGLIGIAYMDLVNRAYFAKFERRKPFMLGVCIISINTVLGAVLGVYLGSSGITVATSLSFIVVGFILVARLSSSGHRRLFSLVFMLTRVSVAGGSMWGCLSYMSVHPVVLKRGLLFIHASVEAVVSLAVYTLVMCILFIPTWVVRKRRRSLTSQTMA